MKPIRNVPHIDGNFSCSIYLIPTMFEYIEDLQIILYNHFKKRDILINNIPLNDLHISLSKTFYINHHQIKGFQERLINCFKYQRSFNYTLKLSNIQIFTNENQNRYFLSLLIEKGSSSIINIIKLVNSVLSCYNLEQFFEVKSTS